MKPKERYEQRKAAHVCTTCRTQDELTLAGATLCRRCAERNREASRNHYLKVQADAELQAARSEKRKRKKQIRKENHQCTVCGAQDERTLAGLTRCAACAERQKEQNRKFKAAKEGLSGAPEPRPVPDPVPAAKEQATLQPLWAPPGHCVKCGRKDDRTAGGCVTCNVCATKAKEYLWTAYLDRLIRKGVLT